MKPTPRKTMNWWIRRFDVAVPVNQDTARAVPISARMMRECLIHPDLVKLWKLVALDPYIPPSRVHRAPVARAGAPSFVHVCCCSVSATAFVPAEGFLTIKPGTKPIAWLDRRLVYVESWLLVEAYIGQCATCGRIYWA